MDSLPRDVQLQIIKRLDIDTRIKMGLVRRLKIPQHLRKLLESIEPPITCTVVAEKGLSVTTCKINNPQYTLVYIEYTYTGNRHVLMDWNGWSAGGKHFYLATTENRWQSIV